MLDFQQARFAKSISIDNSTSERVSNLIWGTDLCRKEPLKSERGMLALPWQHFQQTKEPKRNPPGSFLDVSYVFYEKTYVFGVSLRLAPLCPRRSTASTRSASTSKVQERSCCQSACQSSGQWSYLALVLVLGAPV